MSYTYQWLDVPWGDGDLGMYSAETLSHQIRRKEGFDFCKVYHLYVVNTRWWYGRVNLTLYIVLVEGQKCIQ